MQLESVLLAQGVLNTKDMPPIVGHETGTPWEYVFNVWHWDGALFLCLLLSFPATAIGIGLVVTVRSEGVSEQSSRPSP